MKYSVALCIFISLLTISCISQTKVAPLFVCSDKIEDPYGICSHITRSGRQYDYDVYRDAIASIKELGVDYVRIVFDCSNITPINSPTTTTRYDSIITLLQNKNILMVGLLSHLKYDTRCWDDYSSYWRYVDTLVNRYGKTCRYFEILNEVDRYADDEISNKYVTLLKETYSRIKKINNGIGVLYTGISWSKAGLLNSTMEKGAYNYIDIMNFHVYDKPEKFPSHFCDIKNNMERNGWSKPVWITECGYSTEEGIEGSRQKEERQAKYLPRTYLIAFAYGIEKVFWYNHRSPENKSDEKEDNYGIVHRNFLPKPAYYSYKTLIKMCPSNSTRPTLEIKEGMYISTWERPDSKKVTAIWTIGAPCTYKLEETKIIEIYSYLGNKLKVNKSLNITDKIIYIVH